MSVLGLERGVFLAGQEIRTGLCYVRQLAVTEDAGIGIILSQIFQKLIEGVLLGLCSSIVCMAVLVKTTFIDNAKGTVVVVAGMNALD